VEIDKLWPDWPTNKDLSNRCKELVNWLETHHFNPIATERKVFSKKYWYAGTVDIQGLMGKKPTIVDMKNSNGLYNEFRLQIAAYENCLFEELHVIHNPIYIIRIGDDGEIEELEITREEYLEDFQTFLAAKAIYEWQTKLNKQNKEAKHE